MPALLYFILYLLHLPPSQILQYPYCRPDYSMENQYIQGDTVSYPSASGNSTTKDVFGCQGSNCTSPPGSDGSSWTLVGTCAVEEGDGDDDGSSMPTGDNSPAPSAPLAVWWGKGSAGLVSECVFSDEYPPPFMTVMELKAQFVFDSGEDCCASYPLACAPTAAPNTTMPNIMTPSPTAIAVEPSASPTSPKPTTFTPTYMPTAGGMYSRALKSFVISTSISAIMIGLL